MPKTPDTPEAPTAVTIDSETGLPALPEGYYWKIGRSGARSETYGRPYYSGAAIWKSSSEPWSDWKWSGSDSHYLSIADREGLELETIPLDDVVKFPKPRWPWSKKGPAEDTLLWRFRNTRDVWAFGRYEKDQDDAPWITEDNLLEETTKTWLAWEKTKSHNRVLGDYPPRKAVK